METLLHKFYAASISIGADGSMLVSSTRDRVMMWATIFCISAAICLIIRLVYKKKHIGRAAMACFIITLSIPVLIIPSVRNEFIHVTPTALTVESGEWYKPSRTVFRMSNIRNIREHDMTGLLPGNLIGDPKVSWQVTRHDGDNEIIELNEFFNAHRMVVAYYYIDRGFWLERLEDRLPPPM